MLLVDMAKMISCLLIILYLQKQAIITDLITCVQGPPSKLCISEICNFLRFTIMPHIVHPIIGSVTSLCPSVGWLVCNNFPKER